jgi:sugar phosphate isomerase/epimerase
MENTMNRRSFLAKSTAAALVAGTAPAWAQPAAAEQRYKIGVCDWMILKRQRLGALPLAREIGVDGVEIDMGSLGDRPTFDNKLADETVRREFIDKAKELKLEFCSVAMSGFYAQSFAERPTAIRMVEDCIRTMQQLKVGVAFLPLGVRGDLVQHPELRPAIVERLQAAGKLAEEAKLVIGIETALDAAGEAKLLEEIGSPGVKIFFNFANPLQAGRNLLTELETLGAERICQIHCTDEDGVWLEHNTRLDMPKVKAKLDAMGWQGWLVLERSRDKNFSRDVRKNFSANAAYMKSIFQTG